MTRRGRRRWGLCTRITFGTDGDVYLDRLRLIQTPWFAVYLHRIARADRERDVHNHPWPFASLILRGGYEEEFAPAPFVHPALNAERRTWRRWSFHRMPLSAAHRITAVRPRTVTLVFVGKPSGREWAFFTPDDGPIQWDEYLNRWAVLRGSNQ